jgi:hypothetical protein
MFPQKIISGGQAGVDRAALDVALEIGIPIGGHLPKGRKDENGEVLPDKYTGMQETGTEDNSSTSGPFLKKSCVLKR